LGIDELVIVFVGYNARKYRNWFFLVSRYKIFLVECFDYCLLVDGSELDLWSNR
jgi:hypothetical protein